MNRNSFTIFPLSVLIALLAGCASSLPVELSLTPSNALVFSTQSTQLTVTDSLGESDVVWTVGGITGGTVDSSGDFTAPSVTENTTIMVTASSRRDPAKTASCTITVLAPGQVTATNNPQVALYTLTLPAGTNAFIQFGTDTSYKLKTWTQPAPASGPLGLFVAGMLGSTEYHMRAVVQSSDGTMVSDLDHTFTTQSLPAAQIPVVTATTTAGMTPQPGIELLNLIGVNSPAASLAAVDLSGRLIWSYPALPAGESLQGVHLLPNGHFLIGVSTVAVREIDLAGNTIREGVLSALVNSLANIGITYEVLSFHHDVIALPNGHWIALINLSVPCSDIPNCSGLPNIIGDMLVDLAPQGDGTFALAWTWSTFDHLDINRALQGYPDWTHSNAIVYSPDDGNLLLSIRHQSWIIKIDYANGEGTGDILWRLGYQGDFTLLGGTDPTDWFYAQHAPSFASPNSTGKFNLAVMDNGNLRVYPGGVTCGATGAPACYSTAPLLEIDESAKTATILSNYRPGGYSSWGGEAQQLANGHMEDDFNVGAPSGFTEILEVTSTSDPQVVWQLNTSGQDAYRGFRLPSLYPGVQW
jgi:arylsulfate sulfotransferase